MLYHVEMRRAKAEEDKAVALRMMAASLQVCSKFKCSELPTAQLSASIFCLNVSIRVPNYNRLALQEK